MEYPDEWKVILLARLRDAIAHPTGIWADFNALHNAWQVMMNSADALSPEEIPEEPDPEDYPDRISAKSVDFC